METTKPIHAFVAGTHRTRLGVEVTITAADLQASAAAYNPELHEAPLVVGHPDGAAPAYGWVESCSVDGDNFFIMPRQVNPDFARLHNAGAFKKRSMSFYHPANAENPIPGVWYPRHLGFLGAQPPAVKGLKDYAFAESAGDTLTVEFGEWEDRVEAGLFRSLREWILSKFGKEDADTALPGYAVSDIEHAAAQPSEAEAQPVQPAFSESQHEEVTMTPEQIAAKEAELARREAAVSSKEASFSERETSLNQREQAAHAIDCADFVEQQVQAGKVLPTHKAGLAEFMAGLNKAEATIDFAEADGTVKKSPLDWFKGYLAAQPKMVEFGEHQPGDADAASAAVTVTVPAGYEVNAEKAQIHARAVAFAEANSCDYITAVKAVRK